MSAREVTKGSGSRRWARRGARSLLAARMATVAAAAMLLAACGTPAPQASSGSPQPLGGSGVSSAPSTSPSTSPSTAGPPPATGGQGQANPPHIMILMMENESYGNIIGNRSAPYTNTLAKDYLTATRSYAWGHDSLPNYLEMVSGSSYAAQGTKHDCSPGSCRPITGTNVGDQLQKAGIPWKAYMGGMPSPCYARNAGGKGGYGVRHNPFVYFPQGRQAPECGNDVPSTGLLAGLNSPTPPDFVFYSPAICHDGGHDAGCSTIPNGDRFLSARIPAIMGTKWYQDGGAIVLTWDEGNSNSGKLGDHGGRVLTVVISAATRGASTDGAYLDTAGILRSVEGAYGLPYLGQAARAASGGLPLPR